MVSRLRIGRLLNRSRSRRRARSRSLKSASANPMPLPQGGERGARRLGLPYLPRLARTYESHRTLRGRFFRGGAVPGTSCQATIAPSFPGHFATLS
jgi:hypothetical protein